MPSLHSMVARGREWTPSVPYAFNGGMGTDGNQKSFLHFIIEGGRI